MRGFELSSKEGTGTKTMNKPGDSRGDRFHNREEREKQHRKQLPGGDEEPLPPPVEPIQATGKPKRTEPCPCGSCKKYKQCCGKDAK